MGPKAVPAGGSLYRNAAAIDIAAKCCRVRDLDRDFGPSLPQVVGIETVFAALTVLAIAHELQRDDRFFRGAMREGDTFQSAAGKPLEGCQDTAGAFFGHERERVQTRRLADTGRTTPAPLTRGDGA